MILSLVLVLYASLMQAQVNVGANEDAVAGAILQLKEIANVTDSSQNANRGLALPRVQLSDVNQLYPMFLADPANPGSGANAAYAAGKAALDMTHTGLIVYNVTDDASKGLSPGLAQWDGSKWKALSQAGGTGSAIFAVLTCQDITVNGGYVVNTPTNSQNYLTANLNVTTPGAYTIIAQSNNGYSFYLSGVALNAGPLTVTVPAQGTPLVVSDPAVKIDTLTISGIPIEAGCQKTINVTAAIANYSLNCTTATLNGTYMKGTQLGGGNTLTLKISVSAPGSYYISTPVTNGISFSAGGTWDLTQTGLQTVTLTGSGTPTVNTDFPITINANTQQGSATCSVNVPVTAPDLKYAIIASGAVWSWGDASRMNALSSPTNFGPNGTVKINSFTDLWGTPTSDINQATSWLTNGYPSAGGQFPDVVLYFTYGDEPTVPLAKALAGYVQKGGCLVFGTAADEWTATTIPVIDTLLVNLFGPFGSGSPATSVAVPQGTGPNPPNLTDDNDYPINNLPNDPIINGPFGNLAGYYWGEDNGSTGSLIIPVLPPSSVQICPAYNPDGKGNISPTSSMVWYNTYLNIVYFGDSVGASSNTADGGTQNPGSYPAYYPNTVPTSKLYGPAGYTHYVFNAQLELNAVAWAIKRAITNGINPH